MTHFQGFWVGVLGLVVGVGLTQARPQDRRAFVFRREAMGFGDVTLMGMIGAFMGWQAAVLTFFLGSVLRLGPCGWKLFKFSRNGSAAANYPAPIANFLMGLT